MSSQTAEYYAGTTLEETVHLEWNSPRVRLNFIFLALLMGLLVDKTRVWRKNKLVIMISMMRLFVYSENIRSARLNSYKAKSYTRSMKLQTIYNRKLVPSVIW